MQDLERKWATVRNSFFHKLELSGYIKHCFFLKRILMRIKWLACCHAFLQIKYVQCTYFHILVDLNFSKLASLDTGELSPFKLASGFSKPKRKISQFNLICYAGNLRQPKYVRHQIGEMKKANDTPVQTIFNLFPILTIWI